MSLRNFYLYKKEEYIENKFFVFTSENTCWRKRSLGEVKKAENPRENEVFYDVF